MQHTQIKINSRHNTANASPIRRPVASRNADRSNKSCRSAT